MNKKIISDKNEEEKNVEYRKEFISKYFKYEKNAYRWVHLTGSDAVKLENNEENKLLENKYSAFILNNQKMREYHVNTHSIFSTSLFEKNYL